MASVKICLDAGHYGKYNRSPAVPEYYESDMNWKLHLMLKARLEEYEGVEVIQTRENQETDKTLFERGCMSEGCDLFLSIHSNAVDDFVHEEIDYPKSIVQLDGKGDKLNVSKSLWVQDKTCFCSKESTKEESITAFCAVRLLWAQWELFLNIVFTQIQK